MTQLGRHISPQKEAIRSAFKAQANPLRGSSGLVSLASVLVTFMAACETAFAQEQAYQAVLAPKPSTVADVPLSNQDTPLTPNFNLQLPSTGSTRLLDLNLDFDSIGCLVGEQNCLRGEAPIDMGFTKSLTKSSQKGLDVELVPTASMRFDDESRSAVVGAVVRIGEDLRSKEVASNTWYVFAGADAEALSYTPESATAITRGEFGLSDRIIIGDAQAGIGYRIGSADVSLGYFRREISTLNDSLGTEGFSKTEDAAALSFTWKR